MDFTKNTESADCFHFWTAATMIGASTKRQVWMNMGFFDIFPNLYTILVGPSGAKKSVASDIGISIALKTGLKKFSDKITGAALIKELSEAQEKRVNVTAEQVEFCSPLIIYSRELGVFMGSDAYGSGVIADLTDLYDCPPNWNKKTILRGLEPVPGPFLSMLAASTPQTLKDVIPQSAVGQGFTSRIMFVWASNRRKKIPIPTAMNKEMEANLIHDLKEISSLRGAFQFDNAGAESFKKHYISRLEPEDEFIDERLRGYSSRKDTHIIKLAIILSLATKDELTITEKDVAGAIDAIKWLDQGLNSVFAGHGTSMTAEDTVRVFRQIEYAFKRFGYASQSELTKRNYYYLNAQELDGVVNTLLQADAIGETVGRNPRTGRTDRMFTVKDSNFLSQSAKLKED